MTRHSPDDPISAADPLDRNRFPIDEWKFIEAEYSADDLGVTESLFAVGNGYLGMRGNVEEGRETFYHGTFINGFHDVADPACRGSLRLRPRGSDDCERPGQQNDQALCGRRADVAVGC